MKKLSRTYAVLCATLLTMTSFASASVNCPRAEQDGVWVSACNIGSDIQILYHNNNSYKVKFTVKVSYVDKNGTQVKWIEGRGGEYTGGEITEIRAVELKRIDDIELRNLKKND